jgi:phage baseplate assembly protein V
MHNKTIRYGVVSAVDPAGHAVQVAFEDEDGVVSDWLPVVVRGGSKNKDYTLPDVSDRVVCAFLPNGVTAGFCLGAVYSQANRPPHDNGEMRSVTFADGTTVSYDRAAHILTINCGTGTVNIVAAGNVNVTGDVIADGISLKTHVHPENDSGGPTGPPVGGG